MSDTLFQISTGLTRLMAQREDLLAEFAAAKQVDDQVSIGNAIEALELQIKEEAQPNELAKVDSVRGYLLHCDMMEAAAKEEKSRQAANERHWKATSDFLKRCVLQTLEATGKDRLQGKHGYLRSQLNSAAPAPVVAQPDLVPASLCRMEGWVRQDLWDLAVDLVRTSSTRGTKINDYHLERKPDTAAIKAELEKGNAVAGCSLAEKGKHLRIA